MQTVGQNVRPCKSGDIVDVKRIGKVVVTGTSNYDFSFKYAEHDIPKDLAAYKRSATAITLPFHFLVGYEAPRPVFVIPTNNNPPGNPDFWFGGDGFGYSGNYPIVKRYIAAGINVIPIARGPNPPGGFKRPPKGIKWGVWKERSIYQEEIGRHWCKPGPAGIGIVCGAVSGNLECIDFDTFGYFEKWLQLVDEALFARLVVSATPSGGRHLWYRCPLIEGNKKLACELIGAEVKTHIETRGQGGQFLAPGTPADCHPLNLPYVLIQGTPETIPVITPEERETLLETARSLNLYSAIASVKRSSTDPDDGYDEDSPWADFNLRGSWQTILEPHGWQLRDGDWDHGTLTRPAKVTSDGISASTQKCGGMLHVFSTNAYPFEGSGTYSKSAAWAMLNHDGDYTQSAKDLMKIGYGGLARERQRAAKAFARFDSLLKGAK